MKQFGQIQCDSGSIEYWFERRSETTGVVLSHPHPLYGGSMSDGVLATIDAALESLELSSLRYNFRGVGGSSGEFDQGIGEIEDLRCVVGDFQAEVQHINLVGYSFGASVTLNYAHQTKFAGKVILVSPPTTNPLPQLAAETHVLVGSEDQVSNLSVLREWSQECKDVTLHELDDADHFFAGYSADLRSVISRIFG